MNINITPLQQNYSHYGNKIQKKSNIYNPITLDRTSFTANSKYIFTRGFVNISALSISSLFPTALPLFIRINKHLNLLSTVNEKEIPNLINKFSSRYIQRVKSNTISTRGISKEIDNMFPNLSIPVSKFEDEGLAGLAQHVSYSPIQRFATLNFYPFPVKNNLYYNGADVAENLDTLAHELTHVLRSNSLSEKNSCITSFLADKYGINTDKLIQCWFPFEKELRKEGFKDSRIIDQVLAQMNITTAQEKDWAYKYIADHALDEFEAYSAGNNAKQKIFKEIPSTKNNDNSYDIRDILSLYKKTYDFITESIKPKCTEIIKQFVEKITSS